MCLAAVCAILQKAPGPYLIEPGWIVAREDHTPSEGMTKFVDLYHYCVCIVYVGLCVLVFVLVCRRVVGSCSLLRQLTLFKAVREAPHMMLMDTRMMRPIFGNSRGSWALSWLDPGSSSSSPCLARAWHMACARIVFVLFRMIRSV